MTRVLFLGYDPGTVDYSDPALPPGMTAEKVRVGIEVAMKEFALRGWEADGGRPRGYAAGTWGPPGASALIGHDGSAWREEW